VEAFEKRGEWWLSDQAQHRAPGTLRFSPTEGPSLRLHGKLQGDVSRPPIILGQTEQGEPVTLYRCLMLRPDVQFSERTVEAEVCFLGRHFSSKEELLFCSMRMELDYLAEWIEAPCPWPSTLSRHKICWSLPEETLFRMKLSNAFFEVHSHFFGRYDHDYASGRMKASRRTVLEIKSSQPCSFDDIMRLFGRPVQDLLSLAADKPATIRSILLRPISATTATPNAPRNEPPNEVHAYAAFRGYTPEPQSSPQLLFTLNDMGGEDEATKRITGWLRFYENDRHEAWPLLAYFGVKYMPMRTPIELRFFLLISGIEAWSRTRGKSRGRQCLRSRIKDIVTSNPWVEDAGPPQLQSKAIDDLIGWRNYVAHGDGKKRPCRSKYAPLLKLTQLLLRACLLSDLGFSECEIANITKKDGWFRWLQERLSDVYA